VPFRFALFTHALFRPKRLEAGAISYHSLILEKGKSISAFPMFAHLDQTRAARNLGYAPPLVSKLNELGRSRLLAPIEVAAQK
jgi:hypothetical protein